MTDLAHTSPVVDTLTQQLEKIRELETVTAGLTPVKITDNRSLPGRQLSGSVNHVVTDPNHLPDWITIEDAFANPELLVPPERLSWLTWRGCVSLLIGEKKLGKSTVACGDALSAIRDGKRVLYISVDERPQETVQRFQKYGEPRLTGQLVLLRPGRDLTSWLQLGHIIQEVQPDILYLDSWDKIIGKCEKLVPAASELTAWRRIADQFTDLARLHNIGVTIFIHTPRSDPSRYAGSGQIGAAIEMEIVMSEEGDTQRRLEFNGRYIVEDMLLEWLSPETGGNGSCRVVAAPPKANLTDHQEELLRFLVGGPMTKKLILASATFKLSTFKQVAAALGRRQWISFDAKTLTYSITPAGQRELDIYDGKIKGTTAKPLDILAQLHQPTGDIGI